MQIIFKIGQPAIGSGDQIEIVIDQCDRLWQLFDQIGVVVGFDGFQNVVFKIWDLDVIRNFLQYYKYITTNRR